MAVDHLTTNNSDEIPPPLLLPLIQVAGRRKNGEGVVDFLFSIFHTTGPNRRKGNAVVVAKAMERYTEKRKFSETCADILRSHFLHYVLGSCCAAKLQACSQCVTLKRVTGEKTLRLHFAGTDHLPEEKGEVAISARKKGESARNGV